jgi:hypothetical protein
MSMQAKDFRSAGLGMTDAGKCTVDVNLTA